MEDFSFSPPINLSEEGKSLLVLTSFEKTNSVSNITNGNNSFSFSTPRYWTPEGSEELVTSLNEFLELRSEKDIELHVKEVEKISTRIKIENSGCNLAGFDQLKSEYLQN